jgi:hypothetical protein
MFILKIVMHFQVLGKYITLRDMSAGRPSFKRDISGYKRLFSEFPSQTALAGYVATACIHST